MYRTSFLQELRSMQKHSFTPGNENETPIDALKHDYFAHHKTMNPGATDESTYRASCYYYGAELLPLLPRDNGVRILDVGCGFGHLIRFCHDQGYKRIGGVEIDQELFEAANAYVGSMSEFLVNADAMQFLKEHPCDFDVITLFDVIEHFTLNEAVQITTLIREALQPGGIAIFRTPNMANLFGAYSRYLDLTHQYGYTEQSLLQLLRIAGFVNTQLHIPKWEPSHPLTRRLKLNRWIHRFVIRLQGRVIPRCFEKNIVIKATVPGSTK